MGKTTTLNLRVNPVVKSKAEGILDQLGIPVSTAVNIYLYQISLTGGIPFALTLPKAPNRVNVDLMTDEQLLTKLQRGYDDIEAGRVQDAETALSGKKNYHN